MMMFYLNSIFSMNIANALDLGSTLDNMISSNSTTYPSFGKGANGSMTGTLGGFSVNSGSGPLSKNPMATISLGFQAPSLKIDTKNACHLSIHGYFGGMAFLSSAQISAIIQGITKGAVAFIMHLVIKVLCPACEAVLQLMQNLARLAVKFAMDACKMGQQLAGKAMENLAGGKINLKKEGLQGQCGQGMTAGATSSDWMLGTLESACKDINTSFEEVKKNIGIDINEMMTPSKEKADPDKAAKMKRDMEFGNLTWKMLGDAGENGLYSTATDEKLTYDEKVLLMNIIGTIVIGKENGVIQSTSTSTTVITSGSSSNAGNSGGSMGTPNAGPQTSGGTVPSTGTATPNMIKGQ